MHANTIKTLPSENVILFLFLVGYLKMRIKHTTIEWYVFIF